MHESLAEQTSKHFVIIHEHDKKTLSISHDKKNSLDQQIVKAKAFLSLKSVVAVWLQTVEVKLLTMFSFIFIRIVYVPVETLRIAIICVLPFVVFEDLVNTVRTRFQ